MKNVFARSGERAINLFRKHIFHTQLALSVFYFCIAALMLIVSSQVTRSLFLGKIAPRFEGHIETTTENTPLRLQKPSVRELQNDLQDIMFVVNIIFLALAGVLGYFLAGLTLAPLNASYEKEQRFLNDASHELRTPLAILRTSLENIERKGNEVIKTDAKEAIEEVDRMNHLLQNILTLSRAEQHTHSKTKLSCNELLKEVTERMRSLAEKYECNLSFTAEEDVMLLGNKEALERVFVNLIQNALTYNKPNGFVELSLQKKRSEAIIQIKDTGIGMNKEELAHLTERFYKAEKSRSRSKGGSGLGLAIVEQIIKDHHGKITFASTPEKGTTATVTLPIHKAS